jgi:hypothetical protein
MNNVVYLSLAFVLAGCAGGNVYQDVEGPNVGTLQTVNTSPGYRMAVALFENSQECTGIKHIHVFDSGPGKTVKVARRDALTLALGVHVENTATRISGCTDAFTVPFSQGDLRVRLGYLKDRNRCEFAFESSTDGMNWSPVRNVVRRGYKQPLSQDGSFCETR